MSSDSMASELIAALQRSHLDRISRSIRSHPQQASAAVDASVPLLFKALSKNVRDPRGAEALYRAIERDHDGAVLNRIEDVIDYPESGPGAGILRHVFGDNLDAISSALGGFIQLDSATINRLMTILAPLVLGVLGQRRSQPTGGYDQQRLPEILEREERQIPRGGGIGDILGDILRGRAPQQQPQGGGFPQGGFPPQGQGGGFPQGGFPPGGTPQGGGFPQGGFPPQGQGGGFPQGGFPPTGGGGAPRGKQPGCAQMLGPLLKASRKKK